jgi:hypothetical protein
VMKSTQDSQQHSMPVIEKASTQQGSTPKQQDADRLAWRLELGRKMVEAGNRMETDLEYRKYVQSITR